MGNITSCNFNKCIESKYLYIIIIISNYII